jgi:hypothetical protein
MIMADGLQDSKPILNWAAANTLRQLESKKAADIITGHPYPRLGHVLRGIDA